MSRSAASKRGLALVCCECGLLFHGDFAPEHDGPLKSGRCRGSGQLGITQRQAMEKAMDRRRRVG